MPTFPPRHREEARALVESIAGLAKPDDRYIIRRRVVDAARGDIGKLRRGAPKAREALERMYRLFGDELSKPGEPGSPSQPGQPGQQAQPGSPGE